MLRTLLFRFFVAVFAACLSLTGAAAQSSGPRIALVIGNTQYADLLATSANDAGLIAETLRGAGFDVTGAANLDQDSLRRAFQDFLGKATQVGPDAIAFVYLAGRGLQYEGDNYFAPIDANIARDTDIPLQAMRVSDFTRALAAIPLRARIIVLDAARGNHFAPGGNLAGGLALIDADPGSLYAFNATPGTIAPDEPGPYGAYAQALAEMLRQGGVPVDVAFAQARLRANEATKGAVTPWDAANITPPLALLEGAPNAPSAGTSVSYAALQSRPISSFPANEAYAAALERDTLEGYQDFLIAYPNDPLAARVRALLAARREALTWRRTLAANTPDACWSYMRRYPKGPHFYDARRRLSFLAAPLEPPPDFDVYDFGGLPPPPPAEYVIIDSPVIIFDPLIYPPPPPPPVYFLPPQPVAFIELPTPPPPQGPGFLPIPIPVPVPFGRLNGPPGTVVQRNFGQQGPVGQGGAPGAPQSGQPGQGPGHPGQPATGQPAPAAANPAAPNHALPQGAGLPPVAPNAHPPGAVAPGAPPAASSLKPATPAASPAAPVAPPAAGGGAPNHALPQGAGLPPVAPNAHPPGAPPAASSAKAASPATAPVTPPAAGGGAPNHALPQGTSLPPVPPSTHPAGVSDPGATGSGASGSRLPATVPAAPKPASPAAAPHPAAPPAASRPQVAPRPQPAPQQIERPQAAPPQAQRPQPQAMRPPPAPPPQKARPQPPPQMARPQPQAQPKPAGKPAPAKPGEQANHP
ncbi:caspase family protein [Methylocella sp.]|jgi:uncharacterized caspase-like protein|uniref:caspase family protein n=1 Tax=Methylocella sp. TaxID=1978226 RepID=UPI003C1CAD76